MAWKNFIRDLSVNTQASTLVIQSHREPIPAGWLNTCMSSVRHWAKLNEFEYRFIGDELFDALPPSLRVKTQAQIVIATDLARLIAIQNHLNEGFETVIWCDADFLIFSPSALIVPSLDFLPEGYALGREVWVQARQDNPRQLQAHVKVHNAFMLFRRENSFLDFYADNAARLLQKITGPMPPQFIGPKLLTAIHNVIQCPVIETAGMLSPLVMLDLFSCTSSCTSSCTPKGPALDLFKKRSKQLVAGANLCSSLVDKSLPDGAIEAVINLLLTYGKCI